MAGKKRRAHGTWYRGEHTDYHPVRASLNEPDAVAKYVGHGWFPATPFIHRDQYITAFGGCEHHRIQISACCWNLSQVNGCG
jgi:hypothetical protein